MIDERLRLDGRTVVVAGAGGGGIGTAVCRAIAEVGGVVVGLDRDAGLLDLGRAAVEEAGGRFLGQVVDVRSKAEVDAAFAAAVEAFGTVNGLVNVVGGQQPHHWHALLDFPMQNLDEVLDLNLKYVLLTGQAAARAMIASETGGSIVNIASVAGLNATPFQMAYGAAKAALLSLTKTMAVEWGRHGIRVNAVAPGTIQTPGDRAERAPDPGRDAVLALKRRGSAEELAAAVLFVLSDLGSFVTGQTIIADGGSVIRPSYLDTDDLPVFVQSEEIRSRFP